MQFLKNRDDCQHDIPHLFFTKFVTCFDEVLKGNRIDCLTNKVQTFIVLKSIVSFNEVRIIALGQQTHLIEYNLHPFMAIHS